MAPLLCLAVAIYFEARGEPIDGQYAVAEVVMNRVSDERYPDTVCSVVFEEDQFSFTKDGKPDKLPKTFTNPKKTAIEVAYKVLTEGPQLGITSTHYHTIEVKPHWKDYYKVDGIIGEHIFYTNHTDYR